LTAEGSSVLFNGALQQKTTVQIIARPAIAGSNRLNARCSISKDGTYIWIFPPDEFDFIELRHAVGRSPTGCSLWRLAENVRRNTAVHGLLASHERRSEVIAEETYFMSDYRVNKGEVEEDQLTAAIEKSTSKVPSSAYLALALGAMAVSAGLQAWNRKHAAMFVGQWAAPFLILGIYNKLVKQHGSDGRSEPGPRRGSEYVVSGASRY
jgi:hypothetical protein